MNIKEISSIIENNSSIKALKILSNEIFNYPLTFNTYQKIKINNTLYSFFFDFEKIVFSKISKRNIKKNIIINRNAYKKTDQSNSNILISKTSTSFNRIRYLKLKRDFNVKTESINKIIKYGTNIEINKEPILRSFFVNALQWDKPIAKRLNIYNPDSNIINLIDVILSSNCKIKEFCSVYKSFLIAELKSYISINKNKKISHLP